jgi:hypothetical protein
MLFQAVNMAQPLIVTTDAERNRRANFMESLLSGIYNVNDNSTAVG